LGIRSVFAIDKILSFARVPFAGGGQTTEFFGKIAAYIAIFAIVSKDSLPGGTRLAASETIEKYGKPLPGVQPSPPYRRCPAHVTELSFHRHRAEIYRFQSMAASFMRETPPCAANRHYSL
jgi:hypothetical protein